MLSHIDEQHHPTMVDVSGKEKSSRSAWAQSSVILPRQIADLFDGHDIKVKKGPVFQTAIVAGTMAVKKTADLIPFCHPIEIESCKFNIAFANGVATIDCRVKTSSKTGVEMEALTGAITAALTIYDMCKAMGLEIVIGESKLMEKTGGKHDYVRM